VRFQTEPGEMTDKDKIVRQLLLDVQEVPVFHRHLLAPCLWSVLTHRTQRNAHGTQFGRQFGHFSDVVSNVHGFGPYARLLQYITSTDRVPLTPPSTPSHTIPSHSSLHLYL